MSTHTYAPRPGLDWCLTCGKPERDDAHPALRPEDVRARAELEMAIRKVALDDALDVLGAIRPYARPVVLDLLQVAHWLATGADPLASDDFDIEISEEEGGEAPPVKGSLAEVIERDSAIRRHLERIDADTDVAGTREPAREEGEEDVTTQTRKEMGP